MTRPRILVCDDEEGIRASLRLVLEGRYELSFAVDGEEAIAKYDAQPADLVLLDVKMPKLDGLDVLKHLMALPSPPRVLMLTAYQSFELAQRAVAVGAQDYITKPFDRHTLGTLIERTLHGPAPKSTGAPKSR